MIERFPSLGFDPAPGDPLVLDALARATGRLASRLSSAADQLQTLAEVRACWSGDAAAEFGAAVRRLPRALRDTDRGLSDASVALARWARLLDDLQTEARRAEQDAEVAVARLRAASSEVSRAGLTAPAAPAVRIGGPVDPAVAGGVTALLQEAEQALEDARARGRAIATRASEGARRAEVAVRGAARLAPATPSLLQQIADAPGRFDAWLGDQVREHVGLVQLFADAMTVLGFVLMITGFGGLAVAAVGVATTGLLARYADASPTDVGLAAVGLVTGGGAKWAGTMAKRARADDLGVGMDEPLSLWRSPADASRRQGRWQIAKLGFQTPDLVIGTAATTTIVDRYGAGPGSLTPRLLVSTGAHCAQPGLRAAPRRITVPTGLAGAPAGSPGVAGPPTRPTAPTPAPALHRPRSSGDALAHATMRGAPLSGAGPR